MEDIIIEYNNIKKNVIINHFSNTVISENNEKGYFKLNDNTPVKLPFWGYGKYVKNNIIYNESKIFVIAYYMTFHDNYDTYMTKLGYEVIKEQFKDYNQTSSQLQMLDKLEDAKINGTTLSLGML